MNEAPAAYAGPAFVGWRAWRVMPHETLGGPASVRLCASGTRGLPKVWEPLQAAHAVCGKFATGHDAPWPDCECGLHAYRAEKDARNHFESFVDNGSGRAAAGWAFGRVSLWGRIVEHEHGWRAEHAYPYDVTVYGPPELAETVRGLYAIDVQAAEPVARPAKEQRVADTRAQLAALAKELKEIEADLDDASPPAVKMKPPWDASEALRRKGGNICHELWTSIYKRDVSAVTALELATDLVERGGGDVTRVGDRYDANSISHDLYMRAMYGDVRCFKAPGQANRWASGWMPKGIADLTMRGFVEADLRLEHLDRDFTYISAVCTAAGDQGAATAGEIKEALASIGQKPGWFTQSIARCRYRGWMTANGGTQEPTEYGRSVVRYGDLPPMWPDRPEEEPSADLVALEALREAVAEVGGPVTVHDIAWRFTSRWSHGGPAGTRIRGRLGKLEKKGLVISRRSTDSVLMRYSIA